MTQDGIDENSIQEIKEDLNDALTQAGSSPSDFEGMLSKEYSLDLTYQEDGSLIYEIADGEGSSVTVEVFYSDTEETLDYSEVLTE
jgi:hypothetical protein